MRKNEKKWEKKRKKKIQNLWKISQKLQEFEKKFPPAAGFWNLKSLKKKIPACGGRKEFEWMEKKFPACGGLLKEFEKKNSRLRRAFWKSLKKKLPPAAGFLNSIYFFNKDRLMNWECLIRALIKLY